MKKLELHWKIIIGLVLGMIWAMLSARFGWAQFTDHWIMPWGTIFINMLKLIAIPLVLFSIISGVAGLTDVSRLGRMGAKTLGAYLLTTISAISIGLVMVNTLKPGTRIAESTRFDNRVRYELWVAKTEGVERLDDQSALQTLSPERRVQLEAELEAESADSWVTDKMATAKSAKNKGPMRFIVDMVPSNIFISLNDNSLMLQVIFFAIFFGIALLFLPEGKGDAALAVVQSVNEVFLKMVDMIMRGAPFFVFALLAGTFSKMAGDDAGAVLEIFRGLMWYGLTVILGLALVLFVIYPGIVVAFVRHISYAQFFKNLGPAQMLAFSTSSSAATLPVTMECVNENMRVSEKVSSFVLPIGATVNMDGTSLYQAVAVVFLAQFHAVDLSLAQQLTIITTATLASIGSAAVPSAGLVMLIIVLESVGLNPAWIAIIFPIDRILDMCRTVINVTGDATVSTLIAASENELDALPVK